MWPTDLNYFAIPAAGLAFFVLGALWYGLLADAWMRFAGKREADVQRGAGASTYVVAGISSLICAAVLAWVLRLAGAVTIGEHLLVAGVLSVGLVSAGAAKHYAFLGYRAGLLAIDGGYDLVGFLVMAAIFWVW